MMPRAGPDPMTVRVRKRFFAEKATEQFWTEAWDSSWDSVYGTPARVAQAEKGFRASPTYRLLAQRLPPESLVLEAGCGLGVWARLLGQDGHRAVGLDISHRTLRRLSSESPGSPLVVGDVLSFPFDDRCFDACLSFGVIEHFEEGPERAIAELRRILRPGGLLFCSVPFMNGVRLALRPMDALWEQRQAADSRFAFYQYAYTASHLRLLLEEGGFFVESVHPQAAHMFLVGARPFQKLFNVIYRRLKGREIEWKSTRPASVPRDVDGQQAGRRGYLGASLEASLKAAVQWEPLCWLAGHQVLIVAHRS